MLEEVNALANNPTTRLARLRRSFEPLSRRAMRTSNRVSMGGVPSPDVDALVDERLNNSCIAVSTSWNRVTFDRSRLLTHLEHVQGVFIVVISPEQNERKQDFGPSQQIGVRILNLRLHQPVTPKTVTRYLRS